MTDLPPLPEFHWWIQDYTELVQDAHSTFQHFCPRNFHFPPVARLFQYHREFNPPVTPYYRGYEL